MGKMSREWDLDSKKDDNSDDEEDYSPDCESGNDEESDEDDISGLVDDLSFLNNKSKASERVSDIIDKMAKANSNGSSVTEDFARLNVGEGDNFSTEFKAPFIQYGYIEDNQKYIDIDFLVMTLPKKMFRPEVKDGGKGLNWVLYA